MDLYVFGLLVLDHILAYLDGSLVVTINGYMMSKWNATSLVRITISKRVLLVALKNPLCFASVDDKSIKLQFLLGPN